MSEPHGRTAEMQRRLDEVEKIYLAMPDPNGYRVWAHFSKGTPKEGCTCGRGKGCTDGPPRMVGHEGQPISLRTIQDYLKIIRAGLRARADASREDNRAMAIGRYDVAVQMALQSGEARDLNIATARRAELDGSHLAAEEAARPKVYERVRTLMATVEDYEPPADLAPAEPLPIEMRRFQLERLERLLLQAGSSTARFRALGPPPEDEMLRLAWRRNVLDEALYQTMLSPDASMDKKREMIVRSAGVASMITEGADLVDRLAALEKQVRGE